MKIVKLNESNLRELIKEVLTDDEWEERYGIHPAILVDDALQNVGEALRSLKDVLKKPKTSDETKIPLAKIVSELKSIVQQLRPIQWDLRE